MGEDFSATRQVNRMVFAGVIVGMLIVLTVLALYIQAWRSNVREREISQREKYEACQHVENEPSRIVCINGWGQ